MSDIRLVLLSCCAPCSSGAIRQLADGRIPGVSDFIVLFYNPNIFPESEYQKRLNEQIRYCVANGVKYAVLEYDHDNWRAAVCGLENEPERGARCTQCFMFRFARAVRFARENGYNAISSVLGVSRHKDQSQVDRACYKILECPPPSVTKMNDTKDCFPPECPPPLAGGGAQHRGVANYHKHRYTNRALSQSKHLKKNMTDAERLLWYYLKQNKGFSFRKQAPIGPYVVDFLCVSQKLVVELDGAQHGDELCRVHDVARDKFMSDSGYRVLRFWNDEVFKNIDNVLNTINVFLLDGPGTGHPPSALCASTPRQGGGNCPQTTESTLGQNNGDVITECPPPLAGGGAQHRGVACDIKYIPIKWDEAVRQQINRESDFYRQNYCGCEFSIRKV